MAKSPCPLSKTHFIEKAEPIKLVINGQELVADKREFSTGSFGWFFNGKISVAVDGKPLSLQVGLNLTVVGSKDADRLHGDPRRVPKPPGDGTRRAEIAGSPRG